MKQISKEEFMKLRGDTSWARYNEEGLPDFYYAATLTCDSKNFELHYKTQPDEKGNMYSEYFVIRG